MSLSKLCQWFDIPRSNIYYRPKAPKVPTMDKDLTIRIREIIDDFPAYGVRRIHAVVRNWDGLKVNRKKVHRIVKLNGWQKTEKPRGMRPRVQGRRHLAFRSDQLWAIDTTSIFCGKEGWCYLTAVIDCFDREIVGWRLSSSGKAKVAAAALEDSLRARGLIWNHKVQLTLRSDNGLVFGARDFVAVAQRHGIEQQYITPYSPEQNGMIERFFRSLKEECIWLNRFKSKDTAFQAIADWMDFYNGMRMHSALGYKSPRQYREESLAA
ncbi:MAG: IS3 family transposase [Pseudobdellovibrionaceae bacterium]|nr:IS3 family transposase [Pseudobdellovibrionaceae bacterium]